MALPRFVSNPEEMILHRHPLLWCPGHALCQVQGLGGLHTFLQTAAKSLFRQNLLHNKLYRKHILAEDVPDAPTTNPPYLTDDICTGDLLLVTTCLMEAD